MRGGGGAATLAALPIPLESTGALLNALLSAPAFGRPPPRFPVAAEPPPRANETEGMAKTMNNAIATFTEVFDMGKLHFFTRVREADVGLQSADTIRDREHFGARNEEFTA